MLSSITTVFCVILCSHFLSAQQFGPGQSFRFRSMLAGRRSMVQKPSVAYTTCIGQTGAGDEMRVTFKQTSSRQMNSRNNDLEITARVTSGSISGNFELVTTQYGRIDGVCESSSLGNILSTVIGQRRKSIGHIGTPFNLLPGKTIRIRDNVNTDLNVNMISGGGMALCQVQQIQGNRCMGAISLCCTISKDNRPAEQPAAATNNNQNMIGNFGNMNGGGNFNNGNMGMSVNNNNVANTQFGNMNNNNMANMANMANSQFGNMNSIDNNPNQLNNNIGVMF